MSAPPMDYGPIFFLYRHLFRESRWHDVHFGETEPLGIKLDARNWRAKHQVSFHLLLRFDPNIRFLLIVEARLGVPPGASDRFLLPISFLRHHGKRLAYEVGDFRKPPDDVWVIKTAKNLEAFFVGYDDLARLLGLEPLFTRS